MQSKSLDNTILEEIKSLAGLNYTPHQIGLMLGFEIPDIDAYMADEQSAFAQAFNTGFYTTDIAVRKSIFKMAAAGSSPAQHLARKIQEENELRRLYE